MASVTSSIVINQPVGKVFSYLIEPESQKSLQPGLLEVKVTPDGPIGVGSTYHYTTEVMGRKYETQLQVSAFEENKVWNTKTINVPKSVETAYSFEAVGDTTKLTIFMDLTGGYPAAAEAMVQKQMQQTYDEQCLKIKQALES